MFTSNDFAESQERNKRLQEEFKAKWETKFSETEKQIDIKKSQFQ